MRLELETRRRSLVPLLALGLAGMYLFVFVPLGRRAASLDEPLNQSWRRLAAALGQTNATQLDFVAVTNQLLETRAALVVFDGARKQARARIELDAELRARLGEPFQLVDFNFESGRRRDELSRLARAQKVALEPAVFAGFPDLRADMFEPSLLWAELHFLDCLLTTAINAQVATIHSVEAVLSSGSPSNRLAGTLAELPVHIELTGSAASVGRFLQTLPLRDSEIRAADLPACPTNKPALFIDRIALLKQSPEKPDEVRLALRAVGFVLRE